MKIVCGSCGAKYSIADEKVQGKVFKIRCKKCSNVIVVKGNQDEQAAQEQAQATGTDDFGGAYGGTAGASEWYVVIDGDQVGPITPEEVEAYAASGRITGETYAWREGLDDWQSLGSLDAFAHLADSGSMPADEKTVVADQGFGEQEQAPAEAAHGGQQDEDATTVMPADDFRSQIEDQDGQVAAQSDMGGYDDQGGFGQQDDFGSDAYASGGSNAQAFEESSYGSQAGGEFAEESYGSQAGAADQGGYDDGGFGDQGGYDDQGGYEDQGGYDDQGGYEDQGGFGDSGGGFDSFEDDENYGDSGDYAGDYAEEDGGGDAGGMFSAFDSADEPDDGGYSGFDSSGFDDDGQHAGGSQAAASAGGGGGQEGSGEANDLFASRNENSVLFSLSSLDKVDAVDGGGGGGGGAAGGGGGMPGGMGAVGGGGGAGGGGGQDTNTEGSGLIDIQALASAHTSMSGDGQQGGGGAPGGPNTGPDDPFGAGTMSMPALMPMGSKKSNKGLYIGLGIAGFLLLGVIGAGAYVFLTQEDEPKEKIVEKVIVKEKAPDPEEQGAAEKEKLEADEAEKKIKEGEKPDEDGEKSESKEDGEEKEEVAAKDDEKDEDRSRDRDRDPKPKPKPRPKPKKDDDDINSIIDGVGKGGDDKKDDKKEASSDSNLPPKLSRSMVRNTIRKYNGRVFNCGKSSNKNNLSGRMMVRFTVQPSGRVSASTVTTSKFKGTDVGKCVAGVARSMKFPATQSDLTINYPFTIR
jgi:predicted Zn finger-like uncharacterized protein